ncbi:hypothetical protein P7K49_008971 [Saguinus oedipus]|uniref:Uncharacterized protein n=1 Tax=Saguinus oedipus TaxID=9490 RepID=A0ABQ9W001_SAGOE|nr:hypothetical protein P7K49_008971 [Saguinus oedipus]
MCDLQHNLKEDKVILASEEGMNFPKAKKLTELTQKPSGGEDMCDRSRENRQNHSPEQEHFEEYWKHKLLRMDLITGNMKTGIRPGIVKPLPHPTPHILPEPGLNPPSEGVLHSGGPYACAPDGFSTNKCADDDQQGYQKL